MAVPKLLYLCLTQTESKKQIAPRDSIFGWTYATNVATPAEHLFLKVAEITSAPHSRDSPHSLLANALVRRLFGWLSNSPTLFRQSAW